MKKKTYKILSRIPIVNIITFVTATPMIFCSPGIDKGIYDKVFAYMKKHPDVHMTTKLASLINQGKIK